MLPQPGDLIGYTANGKSALSSRLVAGFEIIAGFGRGREQYSHIAVVANTPGWQYEAVFPWAQYDKIDKSRPYEIWRIGDPSPAQRQRILRWCAEHLGAWYDLIGVCTADRFRIPGTYYCSRYYGEAYLSGVGRRIGDSIMSPDSLMDEPDAVMVESYTPEGGLRGA